MLGNDTPATACVVALGVVGEVPGGGTSACVCASASELSVAEGAASGENTLVSERRHSASTLLK